MEQKNKEVQEEEGISFLYILLGIMVLTAIVIAIKLMIS